jgi:hypothetical protein
MAFAGPLAIVATGAVVWLVNRAERPPAEPVARVAPPASVSAAPSASVPSIVDDAPELSASADQGQGFIGYDTLPDGRKVPDLPADAPDHASFGVVVVTYRGAESAPNDAPEKTAALARAKALVADAKSNFSEAVKKGDRGSMNDAGSVPRGVMEPSVEYVIFTLKKGDVYGEPVDTPRGYWIIKRNP